MSVTTNITSLPRLLMVSTASWIDGKGILDVGLVLGDHGLEESEFIALLLSHHTGSQRSCPVTEDGGDHDHGT